MWDGRRQRGCFLAPTECRSPTGRSRGSGLVHARQIDRTDLRFHDLRVSGLTWVGQAGATGAELMYRGGHANLTSVQIYQDADAQRDRALALAL